MRYSLHEIDKHHVLATTIAVDRDEALEWFSEKLRLRNVADVPEADIAAPKADKVRKLQHAVNASSK